MRLRVFEMMELKGELERRVFQVKFQGLGRLGIKHVSCLNGHRMLRVTSFRTSLFKAWFLKIGTKGQF